jgi:chorismate mutase
MSRERLLALRAAIEAADDALVAALRQRAALVQEIWALKEELGMARFDAAREAEEKDRLVLVAPELDEKALREVLDAVVGRTLRR